MIRFQIELQPALARKVTRDIFWRQLMQPRLAALLVAVLLLVDGLLFWVLPLHSFWLFLLLDLVLLLVFGVTAWLMGSYYEELAEKNFQRFDGAPALVGLDDAGYHFQAAWGQGSIAWSDFQGLWRLKSAWVLLQHSPSGFSVVLPNEQLSEEARAFLRARAAQYAWQLRGNGDE